MRVKAIAYSSITFSCIHASRFAIADWMIVLLEELQQEFKAELSRYQEDS